MSQQPVARHNLIDEVNGLAESINDILNQNKKDRYFEGIALLYSFIEDLLKWLVFTQIIWNKSTTQLSEDEVERTRAFCNGLTLYNLLHVGLSVGLIDYGLFQELDTIRTERNQLVHQYWLYNHKGKLRIFRKKLEKLARLCNLLVGKLNHLIEETGMDASFGFFDIKPGKNFVVL